MTKRGEASYDTSPPEKEIQGQSSFDLWLRSLQKRIEQVLKKEDKEPLPPTEITVFSPMHGTAKDARGLYSLVFKNDIIIPEALYWKRDQLFGLQMVSDGFMAPSSKSSRTPTFDFTGVFLDALQGSRVKIGVIDIPYKHKNPLESKREKRQSLPITTFSQLIAKERHTLEQYARFQKDREEYLISRVDPCIRTLLRHYPELKKKDTLKVLIQIGPAHSGFYFDLLKNKDFQTKRILTDSLTIFDHNSEATRRFMFGMPVSDELVAHAAFEVYFYDFILHDFLTKGIHSSRPIYTLLRLWASLFSFAEIKDLFDAMLASGEKEGNQIFRDHLRKRLWQKKKFVETLPIFEKETGEKFVF